MCIKPYRYAEKQPEKILDKSELERIMQMAQGRIPLNLQDRKSLCGFLGEHQFTAHYTCNRPNELCPKDSSLYFKFGQQTFCNINLLISWYIQKNKERGEK